MKKGSVRVVGACLVVLAFGLVLWSSYASPLFGRADQATGASPRYTVVMTEGHNLLVTDNSNNQLYFYTIDKDKPIGSPLKLRASLDLSKVGEQEIQITNINLEK